MDVVGYDVKKIQIINDWGIVICKSMLVWQKYGKGIMLIFIMIKFDYFVGKYYVLFEQYFQEEYKEWQVSSEGQVVYVDNKKLEEEVVIFFKWYKNQYFNNYS